MKPVPLRRQARSLQMVEIVAGPVVACQQVGNRNYHKRQLQFLLVDGIGGNSCFYLRFTTGI
jgi:hypothetical protein